jgi:hypothetical protein
VVDIFQSNEIADKDNAISSFSDRDEENISFRRKEISRNIEHGSFVSFNDIYTLLCTNYTFDDLFYILKDID